MNGGRVTFQHDYDKSGLYRPNGKHRDEWQSWTETPLLNPKVISLSFARSKITDEDLHRLRPQLDVLTTLEELSLSGTAISDHGLYALPQLESLKTLYVNETHITDNGLARLTKQTNLRSLYLNQTAVSDFGVAAIADIKSLEVVNLYETKISTAGVNALRRSSPQLRIGTPTEGLNWF